MYMIKKIFNKYFLPLKVLILLTLVSFSNKNEYVPLQILFLGHDSEFHNSANFLSILSANMAKGGIHFTFTTDHKYLNQSLLDQFDAVIVYGSNSKFLPDHESALLSFTAGGKGLIFIHSAEYNFLDAPDSSQTYTVTSNQEDVEMFTAKIVKGDHPAIEGVNEFETWDHSFEILDLNNDRTVLMSLNGIPFTWVDESGKGRIFYSAYGHDERTWKHPDFLKLIENGLLWSIGEKAKKKLESIKFPIFSYSESENIPNYEKRSPPPLLQAPFQPEEATQLIQVPVGFQLQLFASEPDISNIIHMNWDNKGRMWVIETVDYPNDLEPIQKGNDRIKIIEDTNGDGKADKFTVFAEGLNIPTSLTFINDGVLVAQAPHFLFLKDTNGDDKADLREIVMEGWGTRDTHSGPSNIRYGFDNKIWGAIGYSGYREPGVEDDAVIGSANWRNRPDDGRLAFGNGLFRMNSDGSDLTFMSRFTNNTWGLGFSETFDIFGSTANNTHSVYVGIPLPFIHGLAEFANRDQEKIDGHYEVRPLTPNIRQVDVHGGFTAAAGHSLYTARSFPQEYWNRIAFVSEPTAKLVHRAIIEKVGAGFSEIDGWNMMASPDEWMSPVQAEVGPDGALWVSDWYNFIIQHNPTPSPDRGGYQATNGAGNAYLNPLRDRERGRIYRISHEEAKNYVPFNLSKTNPNALLLALKADNLFWRLHAQRLLVERGEVDVVEQLYGLIQDQSVDATGLNGGALHALWVLHGLGEILESNSKSLNVAVGALNHVSAGVRKAAAQVLPKTKSSGQAILDAGSLRDADPHTQLAIILKVSELPSLPGIIEVLKELEKDNRIQGDRWLKDAVQIALYRQLNN